jgi:hypothetical protein
VIAQMHSFLFGNRSLQIAVRGNLASFPSQAPSFGKYPQKEIQWRLAVLYFVRGWSHRQLGRRYGVSPQRCGQLISDWRIHAVRMGYVEDVRPVEKHPAALKLISQSELH